MNGLFLKLVLTPALIGAASLAGRRWGPAVSGWLVGRPFTSGPIAFFLAMSEGPEFAASSALGILTGAVSQAAFALAYAWSARRLGWKSAILAASSAFALATWAFQSVTISAAPLFLAVLASLTFALRLMPTGRRSANVTLLSIRPPRWDLPLRMGLATLFVVFLTAAAPALGARLAGLLSPFPLYAAILAVFAHRSEGSDAASGVLRGLLLGLFSFAGFFLVLAALIERQGIGTAFVGAIVVALAVQAASLWSLRRLPRQDDRHGCS